MKRSWYEIKEEVSAVFTLFPLVKSYQNVPYEQLVSPTPNKRETTASNHSSL